LRTGTRGTKTGRRAANLEEKTGKHRTNSTIDFIRTLDRWRGKAGSEDSWKGGKTAPSKSGKKKDCPEKEESLWEKRKDT